MDATIRSAERIERDGLLAVYEVATQAVAEELGLGFARLGGMGAVACTAAPVSDFNRITAIGVDAPVSAADLSAALAWLEERGATGWAFQVCPQALTPEIAAWLAAHELVPGGNGWAKFILSPLATPLHADPAGVTVHRVDASNGNVFGTVMQRGFGAPPAMAQWFGALGRTPGWQAYLGCVDGEPAGVGSLFVDGGVGWLNSAATLPDHRGQGVQSALIARRVADAMAAGATLLTAETGYPADGSDAFPSYRNYRRAGFDLAYVRPNYRRA